MSRLFGSCLLALSICLVIASTAASPARAAEACPNEAFRTGYSAALPDCRAYELVSPPGVQPHWETFGDVKKNIAFGVAAVGSELGAVAASSSAHSAIAFFSTFAPAGSTTPGPFYRSSRGPAGWSTQNLVPPQSTSVSALCLPYMIGWSPDLEKGILVDGERLNGSRAACGIDEPELVPGENRGAQNLFVRDNATGTYQLINQPPVSGWAPSGPEGQIYGANAFYQASSADLGTVAFSEAAKLTADAPPLTIGGPAEEFYYYVGTPGAGDRLLTVLPDGSPTEGMIVDAAAEFAAGAQVIGYLSPQTLHAVAPDGTRAFFVAHGDLYARENPAAEQSALDGSGDCEEALKACTVQIDSSESSEPGGGGGLPTHPSLQNGSLFGASGQGDEVAYFADANRLTADSSAVAEEPDLYEFDFRKPLGERLTDLSVVQSPGEHADVQGFVGTNETGPAGNYAYFVADGILAPNANTSGATATAGGPNLYMRHGGVTTYIATMGSALTDSCDWENRAMCARVSSNGRYLAFDSLERLTGFDNDDPQTSEPWQEIFLYDGQTGTLSCASCGKTEVPPTAPASIKGPSGFFTYAPAPSRLQRNVSDSGQVFFDTVNQLPGARNGQSNVYEFRDRELHLLSTGTAEGPSYFYEASSDGEDVYLISPQALAPGGDPAELAIYDAKVGGGFPSPPARPEPCSGEACRGSGALSPPTAGTPGSALLSGGGNPPRHSSGSRAKARNLHRALKACRHDKQKKKRARCEKAAHKKYGNGK